MQDFFPDVNSLIVSLFEKQINRLFSCFLEVSQQKFKMAKYL